jgi:proton-dependent oligopeptide transporter, POT family
MFICRNRYVGRQPTGSVLGNAFKLIGYAIKHRKEGPNGKFSWDVAKPSKITNKPKWMTFDDAWVDQVRRGLKACYVFAFLPIYWLPYSQISNNLTNQAATMRLDGTPNDIVQNLDPIVLIIFIPLLDQFGYPYIAKKGWNFTPIKKMAIGFMMGTCAMICAAVTQYYIYQMSPCGYNASDQDCIAERGPPPISVWVQALTYAFVAFSEIFTSVVGLEYAFTKAPKNMRSFITGIFWFSNAFSSAIGQAFVPLAIDPHITWLYGSIGIIAFVGGVAFWFTFRKLDAEEARLNALPESTYEGRRASLIDVEARLAVQAKEEKLRRLQELD